MVQNEFNTPNQNQFNQQVTNNMNRSVSNQSKIQEMSSNSVINNNKIFKAADKDSNKRRLRSQIILIVLLLLNIPIKALIFFSTTYEKNVALFIIDIIDILILIIVIWMIINTIRGKTEKHSNIGLLSLSAFILNLIFMILLLELQNLLLASSFIYKLSILFIIVSFNLKCKCRNNYLIN